MPAKIINIAKPYSESISLYAKQSIDCGLAKLRRNY